MSFTWPPEHDITALLTHTRNSRAYIVICIAVYYVEMVIQGNTRNPSAIYYLHC